MKVRVETSASYQSFNVAGIHFEALVQTLEGFDEVLFPGIEETKPFLIG